MKLWKFKIGMTERQIPGTNKFYSGCVAVAAAETVDEAKDALLADAKENGYPLEWLDVADVIEMDMPKGVAKMICVQF